jgi:hypothetical protein
LRVNIYPVVTALSVVPDDLTIAAALVNSLKACDPSRVDTVVNNADATTTALSD